MATNLDIEERNKDLRSKGKEAQVDQKEKMQGFPSEGTKKQKSQTEKWEHKASSKKKRRLDESSDNEVLEGQENNEPTGKKVFLKKLNIVEKKQTKKARAIGAANIASGFATSNPSPLGADVMRCLAGLLSGCTFNSSTVSINISPVPINDPPNPAIGVKLKAEGENGCNTKEGHENE
jgi:hypothetical protein